MFIQDLGQVRGRCMMQRPLKKAALIDAFINARIGEIIDRRPFWSDLLMKTIIALPGEYNQGTVSFTPGSPVVSGGPDVNGLYPTWPVNDVVNTTIPYGVAEIGVTEIIPASMAGITYDSKIYLGYGGVPDANPEVVSVLNLTNRSFYAQCQYLHNPSCTAWQSSLAGQQLRITSGYPIFTVMGVQTATSLVVDQQWGVGTIFNLPYQIYRLYFTIDPNFKRLIVAWDPQQSIPLRLHISQNELAQWDPQRDNQNNPLGIADYIPDSNGNTQFEIWPAPTDGYQIQLIYAAQWPKLVADSDRLPPFINPEIIVQGALAEALRTREGPKDPYYDINLAREYEAKFQFLTTLAANSDEERCLTTYTNLVRGYQLGSNWAQNHISSSTDGDWAWDL